MIKKLGYIEDLVIYEEIPKNLNILNMMEINTDNMKIYIDMSSAIDKEKEKQNIKDEIKKAEAELLRANKMLKNETFISKAPEALVFAEKEKVKKYDLLVKKLNVSLKNFN